MNIKDMILLIILQMIEMINIDNLFINNCDICIAQSCYLVMNNPFSSVWYRSVNTIRASFNISYSRMRIFLKWIKVCRKETTSNTELARNLK